MNPDGSYLAVNRMLLESTYDCSLVSFVVPPIQVVELSAEDEEIRDDNFQPGILLVGEGAVPDHLLCRDAVAYLWHPNQVNINMPSSRGHCNQKFKKTTRHLKWFRK